MTVLLALLTATAIAYSCTVTINSISRSGTASTCPNGGTNQYGWNVNDTVTFGTVDGPYVVHTFASGVACSSSIGEFRYDSDRLDDSSTPYIAWTEHQLIISEVPNDPPSTPVQKDAQWKVGCTHSVGSPIVFVFQPYIDLTSIEDGVPYDIRGIGRKYKIGWTKGSANVAFLVRGNDGSNILNLFGDMNEQAAPLTPNEEPNGYRALRVFDLNHDNKIDGGDPIWNELNLWFDRNHNGLSEPDELSSLSQNGVVSLDLGYKVTGQKDQFKNLIRFKADATRSDGKKISTYDIYPAQTKTQIFNESTVTYDPKTLK